MSRTIKKKLAKQIKTNKIYGIEHIGMNLNINFIYQGAKKFEYETSTDICQKKKNLTKLYKTLVGGFEQYSRVAD